MKPAKIDARDWKSLSFGEHVYQIEVEGYTVLPDMLSTGHLDRLWGQTAQLETFGLDYSVHQ